jgi:hypothetical protein
VEAFEIERQKVRWINEGVAAREVIVGKQAREMRCLGEKWNRIWQAMLPGSLVRESQWKAVVDHVEGQIRHECGDSENAQKTTRGLIAKSEALPRLGPSGPNTIRKVTTSNTQRMYSRYGNRRALSSFG